MIEFDGISFNELISRRIMGELAGHDPSYADLAHDQIPNRVTRYQFHGRHRQDQRPAVLPENRRVLRRHPSTPPAIPP